MHHMDLAKAISNNYVFRDLAPEAVSAIVQASTEKLFFGGDILIRQFDSSSDLLVVLEGQAKITSFTGEKIAECGPGSVIGEISLVDDQPRSATVIAVGDVRAAVIPSDALRNLIDTDPATGVRILKNIARVLSYRLRAMNVHVDGMH